MERTRHISERLDTDSPESDTLDGTLESPLETLPGNDVELSYDPAAAEEIWRIAARLQAEAARRLDDRSRAIAQSGSTPEPVQSFSLSEVKLIGDEAGIDPQYIELALRQHAAQQHAPKAVSSAMSDVVGWFLSTPENHITVTRVIRADKSRALNAMHRLFPPSHIDYNSSKSSVKTTTLRTRH